MKRYTEKIRIRVTKEELEHLRKCSKLHCPMKHADGRDNFSAYLRDLLLSGANYKSESLQQQMRELRYEIRKVGVNINQVTKKINAGFGTATDLRELQEGMAEVRQALKDYERAVAQAWGSQS